MPQKLYYNITAASSGQAALTASAVLKYEGIVNDPLVPYLQLLLMNI